MTLLEPNFSEHIALSIRNRNGLTSAWEVWDAERRQGLPVYSVEMSGEKEGFVTATIACPAFFLMLAYGNMLPVGEAQRDTIDGYMALCVLNTTGRFMDTVIWDGKTGAVLNTIDFVKIEVQAGGLRDLTLTFRTLFAGAEVAGFLEKKKDESCDPS